LVLQPAISQLVADAQTAGLTVDGPDGPGHADRRAVLDLPAATPGPEGRSWQVLNKQIKDIIQKIFTFEFTSSPARTISHARHAMLEMRARTFAGKLLGVPEGAAIPC
jgi:hypothetical protein